MPLTVYFKSGIHLTFNLGRKDYDGLKSMLDTYRKSGQAQSIETRTIRKTFLSDNATIEHEVEFDIDSVDFVEWTQRVPTVKKEEPPKRRSPGSGFA